MGLAPRNRKAAYRSSSDAARLSMNQSIIRFWSDYHHIRIKQEGSKSVFLFQSSACLLILTYSKGSPYTPQLTLSSVRAAWQALSNTLWKYLPRFSPRGKIMGRGAVVKENISKEKNGGSSSTLANEGEKSFLLFPCVSSPCTFSLLSNVEIRYYLFSEWLKMKDLKITICQ